MRRCFSCCSYHCCWPLATYSLSSVVPLLFRLPALSRTHPAVHLSLSCVPEQQLSLPHLVFMLSCRAERLSGRNGVRGGGAGASVAKRPERLSRGSNGAAFPAALWAHGTFPL